MISFWLVLLRDYVWSVECDANKKAMKGFLITHVLGGG